MSTTLPITATTPPLPARRPRLNIRLLTLGRQIHLYLGLFSAPALLFFALSGALQTFSLHEPTKGGDYKPANWIVVMAQLHKHQTAEMPPRKEQPTTAPLAETGAEGTSERSSRASLKRSGAPQMKAVGGFSHHALPLQIFFVIVSVSLFFSVLTGVYMCYNYSRNKRLVTSSLVAGLLIPIFLIFV